MKVIEVMGQFPLNNRKHEWYPVTPVTC